MSVNPPRPPETPKPAFACDYARMWDLVRYQRSELLEAGLIDRYEYAALCSEETADKPGQGSPSPRRLESYDELRKQLDAQRAALATVLAELELLKGNYDRKVDECRDEYRRAVTAEAALVTVTQERDDAVAKQSEFLSLKEVLLRPGDYRARFEGEGATLLFMALAHAFTEVGGKNFVEMKVGVVSMQSPDFLLTMQKLDGKTPADLHAEEKALRVAAEADLATARERLAAVQELLDDGGYCDCESEPCSCFGGAVAQALTADAAATPENRG